MMSHTEGPWVIYWSMGRYGEHHNIVRADEPDIGRIGFVEAYAPTRGDMEREGIDNAYLISAAPDLLEALQSCIQAITYQGADEQKRGGCALPAPVVEMARVAINKATVKD